MRALVCLALLAGCVHTRWVVVEVRSAGAPVEGATVSAVCKQFGSAADRSGDDGTVALAIRDRASTCTITASHEDLRAARAESVRTCADRTTCEPVTLELEAPVRLVACLLLLSACDPVWQLHTKVTTPDGAPVSAAALSVTCPDFTGEAALTDVRGDATLGGLGTRLPANCTVTVVAPGGVPFTTTFEAICAPHSIDACYRVRDLAVVLP